MADPTPNVYDVGDTATLTCVFTTLATKGAIVAGSNQLTVQEATGYAQNDPILVVGAGPLGGDLSTTIASVAGSVFTLAANAATKVNGAFVGKLTNPGTVTCKVKLPTGALASPNPSVSSPSTGRYTAPFDITMAGDHFYEFASAGSTKGEEERQFVVREDRV